MYDVNVAHHYFVVQYITFTMMEEIKNTKRDHIKENNKGVCQTMNRSVCVKDGGFTAAFSAEADAAERVGGKLVGDRLRPLAPLSDRHTHTSRLNFLHYFRLRFYSYFSSIRLALWHKKIL